MTREQAEQIARKHMEAPMRNPATAWRSVALCVEAIFEAVAIEREACAKVCDSVDNYANPMTAKDCADAIRARSA